MKELPYFKFYPTEWFMGDISMHSPLSKAVFIEICALYWHRNAELYLDEAFLSRRLGITQVELKQSLAELKDCLEVLADGKITINFLDEQRQEFVEIQERKIAAGRKGGSQRVLNKIMGLKSSTPQADLKQNQANEIKKESKMENKKEIEKDKDKENIKRGVSILFKRKDTTKWTEKENARLNEISKRADVLGEFEEIRKLYESGYKYRRQDIITLLNNWAGELDRARNHTPETTTGYEEPKALPEAWRTNTNG